MQQQIEGIAYQISDEKKLIEWAFGITMNTWFRIEKMVDSYRFIDQQEEIGFYKKLKPQFTSLIDYFTLLYKSALFQPDDCISKKEYWACELKHCKEFMTVYKMRCRHFDQQNSNTDIYFLRQNNCHPLIFGINVNHFNFNTTTYSDLLSRALALKKYIQYIREKKMPIPSSRRTPMMAAS